MHRPLKISYCGAIRFTLTLTILALSSINLKIIFASLGWNLPQYILSPLLYVMPFALFFLSLSQKIQRKDLLPKHTSKGIYPLLFLLISCGIIMAHHISSRIPEEDPVLEKMYQEMEQLLKQEAIHPISLVISTVVLAPLCEEIFFRGILLKGMIYNKIHPIKAILFSSFLFGFIHMNPWQFVGGMIIGSLLGLIYFCTRSIFNCILLHAFNNGLAIVAFLSEKERKSDRISTFLDANPWLFFVTLGLTIVGTYALIHQTKKTWKNWSLPPTT